MKKILSLIILVLLTSLSIGCSSNEKLEELTKEDKIEDFDYFINVMNDNYCNFDVFYNKYKVEYLDLYEVLKEEIENTNNNKEFFDIMNVSIELLKDGHSNLIAPSQIEWIRDIYDDLIYQKKILSDKDVIEKNKKWEIYLSEYDNLQSLYKSVNDKLFERKEEKIETKIIDEEIAYLKVNSFSEFTNEEINKIREFYKIIDNYDDYIIDVRGNGGGAVSSWMDNIVNPIVNGTYQSTTYELHKNGKITQDYYQSRGIELKDIADFPQKDILKNVRNIEDYKYYSEYNMRLTNESIWENGKDRSGYSGNIYLLVDEYTFSSSEALAVFCKNSGFAKVVGNENSGGDGVGIDPIVFTLPNSGLVVRTTAGKGLNQDGSSNLEKGTSLDLYVNSLEDLIEYIK